MKSVHQRGAKCDVVRRYRPPCRSDPKLRTRLCRLCSIRREEWDLKNKYIIIKLSFHKSCVVITFYYSFTHFIKQSWGKHRNETQFLSARVFESDFWQIWDNPSRFGRARLAIKPAWLTLFRRSLVLGSVQGGECADSLVKVFPFPTVTLSHMETCSQEVLSETEFKRTHHLSWPEWSGARVLQESFCRCCRSECWSSCQCRFRTRRPLIWSNSDSRIIFFYNWFSFSLS